MPCSPPLTVSALQPSFFSSCSFLIHYHLEAAVIFEKTSLFMSFSDFSLLVEKKPNSLRWLTRSCLMSNPPNSPTSFCPMFPLVYNALARLAAFFLFETIFYLLLTRSFCTDYSFHLECCSLSS